MSKKISADQATAISLVVALVIGVLMARPAGVLLGLGVGIVVLFVLQWVLGRAG